MKNIVIAKILAAALLALARSAEAKIVYTPADVTIGIGGTDVYGLDLNHDGVTDVTITFHAGQLYCRHYGALTELPASGNGVVGSPPSALNPGQQIGSAQSFSGYGVMAGFDYFCGHDSHSGKWWDVTDRYLGVELQINGRTHYGWAQLSVHGTITAKLTGYAYETIPNKAIIAGRTKSAADEWEEEDFGTGACLTSPIPVAPQPASLGTLALGAQGVPLRRKESSAQHPNTTRCLLFSRNVA
jgi:hypothetical protein